MCQLKGKSIDKYITRLKSVNIQSECEKGPSVSFQDGNVSNYEIMSNGYVLMSNENVSMSNQCKSNQDKRETSVCESLLKKPETTVHSRPVRERMQIKFNDYELS